MWYIQGVEGGVAMWGSYKNRKDSTWSMCKWIWTQRTRKHLAKLELVYCCSVWCVLCGSITYIWSCLEVNIKCNGLRLAARKLFDWDCDVITFTEAARDHRHQLLSWTCPGFSSLPCCGALILWLYGNISVSVAKVESFHSFICFHVISQLINPLLI